MNEAEGEKNGGWNGRGKMKRWKSEAQKKVRGREAEEWKQRITSARVKKESGKLNKSEKIFHEIKK